MTLLLSGTKTPRPVPCVACSHRWGKHSAGIGRCGERDCSCLKYQGNALADMANAMAFHDARAGAASARILAEVLADLDRMAANGNRWAAGVARDIRGADAAIGGNTEALTALGLAPGATPDEVKAAFRKRAREAHPDHGGTDEKMHELVRLRDEALASLEVA